MIPKIALCTQTYRNDYNECKLLCESVDLFVPKSIPHYIFVNDEDYSIFKNSDFFSHRNIHKKSSLLPWYLWRLNKKILGHQYYFGPFTIPVREWIIQQICKLNIFKVIPPDINAVINLDSEVVFLKQFDETLFIKDNKYLLFKETFKEEPNHQDYCKVGINLLGLNEDIKEVSKFCYQSASVVFVRENLKALHKQISKNTICNSWKLKLCNTYRFSEYYLYGLFNEYIYEERNHFVSSERPFPMIDISTCNEESFKDQLMKLKSNPNVQGAWLQKHQRNNKDIHSLSINKIRDMIHNLIFNPI